MEKVIVLNKPVGISPLDAIKLFKEKNSEYASVRMGYAGRLDPMAEGVLVCLVGDENKKINDYMGLDKEYKTQILFGFKSDTYDLLGIAKKAEVVDLENVKVEITRLKGKHKQKLPIYSSYRVKGKPLFWYAQHGKKVLVPSRIVDIKSVKIDSVREISSGVLLKQILGKLKKVQGNFRQAQIIGVWKKLLDNKEKYHVILLTIKCSSGTYIRSIADELGGLLFDLKRVRVGRYNNLFKCAKLR